MSTPDVNIIRGYTELLNPENVAQNVDVKELERSMIEAGIYSPPSADPTDKFLDEISKTASKIGISFDVNSSRSTTNQGHTPAYAPVSDRYDDSRSQQSSGGYNQGQSMQTFKPSDNNAYDNDESDDNDEPNNLPASYSDNFRGYTQEQERRSQINNVFGKAEPQFSIDAEKREDMKCAMLAEIDSIRSVLEGEDIDLSRIPAVDQTSSYEAVESVLKILRHKNDHASYCSVATEFVMFGAYGLEELFDGKTTYLGRYQPDLTDWSSVVQTKLRRMRHSTGQVVSDLMQTMNIGAGMRILLELLPSMMTHSHNRKKTAAEGDMFNDASMSKSTQNLRGMGQ